MRRPEKPASAFGRSPGGNPTSALAAVFHSVGLAIAAKFAVVLAVVFWLALGYWVNRDARRRVEDPFVVGIATVIGLFPPFLGPVIYLLFRPAETLADVRARRAELRALEQQLARGRPTCPECSSPIAADYFACPVCATRLRQPCVHCDAPLEPLWQMCPYCASPIEPSSLDLDAALTAEARTLHALDRESEVRVADV